MASRMTVESKHGSVFRIILAEPSDGQPRLDWVNGPEIWEPQLNRSLPHLPNGPVPDRGDCAGGIGSGLPTFAERPVFVFDRAIKSMPPFEIYEGRRDTLLVNERAKARLESVDPSAFAFAEVETRLSTGEMGPQYWICDAIRALDAFDVEASEGAQVTHFSPRRFMISPYRENNVFKRSAIGGGHFFRLLHSPRGIYCDASARAAIYEQPKLRGVICDFVGAFHA